MCTPRIRGPCRTCAQRSGHDHRSAWGQRCVERPARSPEGSAHRTKDRRQIFRCEWLLFIKLERYFARIILQFWLKSDVADWQHYAIEGWQPRDSCCLRLHVNWRRGICWQTIFLSTIRCETVRRDFTACTHEKRKVSQVQNTIKLYVFLLLQSLLQEIWNWYSWLNNINSIWRHSNLLKWLTCIQLNAINTRSPSCTALRPWTSTYHHCWCSETLDRVVWTALCGNDALFLTLYCLMAPSESRIHLFPYFEIIWTLNL